MKACKVQVRQARREVGGPFFLSFSSRAMRDTALINEICVAQSIGLTVRGQKGESNV